MFTLALVRFPPTATKEIQYLNAKGALTYTDIAGDPVLYSNLPPREISMKVVFSSGDSSMKFKLADGQAYLYAPSYISSAYHLLIGFLLINEPPDGDLQERVVIRLRSLRLLRVSGIVMRLRMFLLLITFLKASHSFRNRLLVICKNAYLFATMIMTSVSSPFSCCSGIVRLNLM